MRGFVIKVTNNDLVNPNLVILKLREKNVKLDITNFLALEVLKFS